MKLKDWLKESGMTALAFSSESGVDVTILSRAMNGGRIPNKKNMERIVSATNGAVQPNDFYNLPPLN